MSYWSKFTPDDLFKELISIKWIFQQVFGDLLPKLIYSKSIMETKNYLKNVYKIKDIDSIFIDSVDKWEFKKISQILFRFSWKEEIKTWLFGNKKTDE